jgi:hypothetical protein
MNNFFMSISHTAAAGRLMFSQNSSSQPICSFKKAKISELFLSGATGE